MSQLEENVGLTLEQTRGRSPLLHREGSGVQTEPRSSTVLSRSRLS